MDSDKEIAIELRGVDISAGSRLLMAGVGAILRRATLCALIGRNGAGKSTLLHAIAGLRPIRGGQILVGGRDLRELDRRELARQVAVVTTERIRVPSLSCRDIVAMGRAPYTNWMGHIQAVDREIVDAALESVGMADYARRPMTTMSDGECQRVMIARAIAQDTPVILLDEPTSFLDMPGRYALAELLGSLVRDRGKAILFSTHELDIASRTTDRTWIIDTPALVDVASADLVGQGYINRIFQIPVLP